MPIHYEDGFYLYLCYDEKQRALWWDYILWGAFTAFRYYGDF